MPSPGMWLALEGVTRVMPKLARSASASERGRGSPNLVVVVKVADGGRCAEHGSLTWPLRACARSVLFLVRIVVIGGKAQFDR